MAHALDFNLLVELHYQPLYRFALSLTRDEADSCDLTQETFHIWARKGHQLHDPSKVKSWLFTTLHRLFLEKRRRMIRFEHCELSEVEPELPPTLPETTRRLETLDVLEALGRLDPIFRAPLALCYLEDFSYQEIADTLEVPLGTVKSRIARGLGQLQAAFARESNLAAAGKGVQHG